MGRWKSDLETVDGEPVELELTTGPSSSSAYETAAELKPLAALAPNTHYVIRAKLDSASGGKEDHIDFTTGADVAVSSTEGPDLIASFRSGYASGCEPEYVACLSVGDHPALVELIDATGEVLVRDVVTSSVLTFSDVAPQCIRARARNAAGVLSSPVEICRPELVGSALGDRGKNFDFVCDDGEFSGEDEPLVGADSDHESDSNDDASNEDDNSDGGPDSDGLSGGDSSDNASDGSGGGCAVLPTFGPHHGFLPLAITAGVLFGYRARRRRGKCVAKNSSGRAL